MLTFGINCLFEYMHRDILWATYINNVSQTEEKIWVDAHKGSCRIMISRRFSVSFCPFCWTTYYMITNTLFCAQHFTPSGAQLQYDFLLWWFLFKYKVKQTTAATTQNSPWQTGTARQFITWANEPWHQWITNIESTFDPEQWGSYCPLVSLLQ